MSSDYVIQTTDLGKSYHVYDKPIDRLKQMLFGRSKKFYKEFWALKDVSFSIRRGETIGIIGRNGSGKSTLLQMLCGTLNPTLGKIKTQGRIAALLELGAGFNPEFSGVENVYMAASLYGLSREEIDKRFEDIANFSDIGDHINQPVKTYSSGMYVRLAFAVIAHVDADILVVDEALAVGDAVFTQKCMRFIRKFKDNGTLIFVSHDMGSVLNLCERAIWLDSGRVRRQGTTKDVSEAYLQSTLQEAYGLDARLESIEAVTSEEIVGKGEVQTETIPVIDYHSTITVQNNLSASNGWKSGAGEILSVQFRSSNQLLDTLGSLKGGEHVEIVISAIALQDMVNPILGFLVRDKLGQDLFGENTLPVSASQPHFVAAGEKFQASFKFKLPMLPNGDYSVMTSLADGDLYNNVQHHWMHDALLLHVASSRVRWGLVGVQFQKIDFNKI